MSRAQQLEILEHRRELKAQHTGRLLVRPLSSDLDAVGSLREASDEQVLAWLAERGLALQPPAPSAGCSLLRAEEIECSKGWHSLRDGTTRRCPVMQVTTERRRLSDLLLACGIPKDFDETREDLPAALLARIDRFRQVDGLPRLLEVARDAIANPLAANTALSGSCGTAKTQVLLAVYFAALRKGVRAQWRTSHELHELALRVSSHDATERRLGHDIRRAWAAAELLVMDDIADRRHDPRAPCSGLLLDILAAYPVVAWASNLDEDGLRAHHDVGDRVVSRLFADRQGVPCRIVALKGEDQRQHALRTRWRNSGRERALGEDREARRW